MNFNIENVSSKLKRILVTVVVIIPWGFTIILIIRTSLKVGNIAVLKVVLMVFGCIMLAIILYVMAGFMWFLMTSWQKESDIIAPETTITQPAGWKTQTAIIGILGLFVAIIIGFGIGKIEQNLTKSSEKYKRGLEDQRQNAIEISKQPFEIWKAVIDGKEYKVEVYRPHREARK